MGRPKQPLLCINTGVVYESMISASKTLGIEKSQISHQLSGKCVSVNGLVFVKINGTESIPELENIIASTIKSRYKIAVNISVTLFDYASESEGGEFDG